MGEREDAVAKEVRRRRTEAEREADEAREKGGGGEEKDGADAFANIPTPRCCCREGGWKVVSLLSSQRTDGE